MDEVHAQKLVSRVDASYVQEMRNIDPACMPPPSTREYVGYLQFITDFAYRSTVGCLGDEWSDEQKLKYSMLMEGVVVTALPAPEVSATIAAYATGETISDSLKCIARAAIDASDMRPEDKENYRSKVHGIFALKDAREFFQSLSIAVPQIEKIQRSPEIFSEYLSAVMAAPERVSDYVSELDSMTDIFADLTAGQTRITRRLVYDDLRNCKYDTAEQTLDKVNKAFRSECRAYGLEVREVERKLRHHLKTNYRLLSSKAGQLELRGVVPASPATQEYVRLREELQDRQQVLQKFATEEHRQNVLLRNQIKQAKKQYHVAKRVLSKYVDQLESLPLDEACKKREEPIRMLQALPASCRKDFSFERNPKLNMRIHRLDQKIKNNAEKTLLRLKSSVEAFEAMPETCKTLSAYEERIENIRQQILNNPIRSLQHGQCRPYKPAAQRKMMLQAEQLLKKAKEDCKKKENYNQCPKKNPGNKRSYKFDSNNIPNDGTHLYCSYFKDGVLESQRPFVNGKEHGLHISWWTLGGKHPLSRKTTYSNGIKHGMETYYSWCPKGNQKIAYKTGERLYENGKKKGAAKNFKSPCSK